MASIIISSPRNVGHEKTQLVPVGQIGYGLMRMTWAPTESPDEQALKAVLCFLNSGGRFLDSGEFYGNQPDRMTANLELLARFFETHPEWAEDGKCFLSVKGGLNLDGGKMNFPDGSIEGLRKSVNHINSKLGGKKKMDLFQMARVDKKLPIEEAMKNLKALLNEGKFNHIGLSEVSAETIRRAHAIYPVSAVEVEYSPVSFETKKSDQVSMTNGVLSTCKELRNPIVAYSPLGLDLLTGKFKSLADLPPDDMRHHYERFQPENFYHNLKLVDQLKEIATEKGCTPVQLALSWLLAQSELIIPIPGSTRAEEVKECVGTLEVKLSEADLKKLREMVDKADVKGGRYDAHHQAALDG